MRREAHATKRAHSGDGHGHGVESGLDTAKVGETANRSDPHVGARGSGSRTSSRQRREEARVRVDCGLSWAEPLGLCGKELRERRETGLEQAKWAEAREGEVTVFFSVSEFYFQILFQKQFKPF